MSEFSRRLKDARLAASLTQDELAKALDVSKSTISMWENGKRIPSVDVTFPLSKVLRVSPGYFTGGSVRVSGGSVKPGSAYHDSTEGAYWDALEELFDTLDSKGLEQLIQYGQFLMSQKEK